MANRNLKAAKAKALPSSLLAFVHEYDGNGGNGTRAWQATHPATSKSYAAAATSAWEALKNPEVQKMLNGLRAARFNRLAMKGDEALARVSLTARVDPRQLFDEKGKILPVRLWPANVAACVKSFKVGRSGQPYDVKFYDALHAQRIILEQTGKLKNPLSGLGSELARLLSPDPE